MEKWFDEVNLSSHPIEEIGIAFYIREILKNNCTINVWDLRETFGERYLEHISNLKREGILRIRQIDTQHIRMHIFARGDKHREKSRKRQETKRKEIK